MEREKTDITERLEKLAIEADAISATASMCSITCGNDAADVPSLDIISQSFMNIGLQLQRLSDDLSEVAGDMMRYKKETEAEGSSGGVAGGTRDIDKAIREGMMLVQKDEDLDLSAAEIMELYDRYEGRGAKKVRFDAITDALHDAFLVGVIFGRQRQQEKAEKAE